MRVLVEFFEIPADPVLAVGGNSELAEASPQFVALWFELVVAIRPGVWPLQVVASGLETFHLAAERTGAAIQRISDFLIGSQP